VIIDLTGRVALVTGGGSGIGEATALAYAAAGASVVVADIDRALGAAVADRITAGGGNALFVPTDVSQRADVERLVATTVERFGHLDCAFNNAGIQGDLRVTDECSEENFDRIVAVNLKGVWLCLKYQIAQMLRQGGGAIVNNSSNFGLVGSQGMPAYCAAKHGVIGLTKTAALENAQRGIRVNAVCPGPVQTPLVDGILALQPELADTILESIKAREPVGRMGRSEEIATAVVWLSSDAASFVTGAALPVDGGFVAQ
jgi:NAD(P)-dependent dehydrogenase (short-subunit alcohol dehydrogenase family)